MGNPYGRNHTDERRTDESSYPDQQHRVGRDWHGYHGDDRLYRGGSSDRGDYYDFPDEHRGSYGGGNYGERRGPGGGDYTNTPARGPHRGKGPAGFQRSDERLKEMVSEALFDDEFVDASDIVVEVSNGEVTLTGTVEDRRMKRLAEDCVDRVLGVKDVHNQLRLPTEPATVGATSAKA